MTDNEAMIVCRCEEITDAAIAAAIENGARTLNDVKRRTRAGMGMCQGRWCSHAIAAIVAAETGQPLTALGTMTARPPVQPVTLGVLADLKEG
ncbi:MAG: (2Fe-2S)-binding protein [Thermomicrobia bacterium]|nr:(2Fe-2S)-binding protein [Thermomicrobia bacterium]